MMKKKKKKKKSCHGQTKNRRCYFHRRRRHHHHHLLLLRCHRHDCHHSLLVFASPLKLDSPSLASSRAQHRQLRRVPQLSVRSFFPRTRPHLLR